MTAPNTRRTGGAAVVIATAALVVAGTACGASTPRTTTTTAPSGPGQGTTASVPITTATTAAPTTSTAAPATTSTEPGAALAGNPGDWLALADSTGVEIWSRGHGTTRITGPVTSGVVYGDLTWSSDGRYLGWYEEQTSAGAAGGYEPLRDTQGADCGPGKVVVFDTRSGTATAWDATDLFQPMVVTAGSVYVFADEDLCGQPGLVHYLPDGDRAAVPVVSSGAVGGIRAWASGADFVGVDGSEPPRVFSVSLTGVATLEAEMPTGAGTPTAEQYVGSPDGRRAAAEVGFQTQGNATQRCGIGAGGPGSELATVDLFTGGTSIIPLPSAPTGMVAQIGSFDYGPGGTLDAVVYDCSPTAAPGTPLAPPAVLELTPGGFLQVATGAVAAERSASGSLAVLAGQYGLVRGAMPGTQVVTSSGSTVYVDGATVPGLNGTVSDLAWSPPSPGTAELTGQWTEPSLTITPASLGAVRTGMTVGQAELAAGVGLVEVGNGVWSNQRVVAGQYVAEGDAGLSLVFGKAGVSCLDAAGAPTTDVATPEGVHLGDTVKRLLHVYGSSLTYVPASQQGINPAAAYVLHGSAGNLVFWFDSAGTITEIAAGPAAAPGVTC